MVKSLIFLSLFLVVFGARAQTCNELLSPIVSAFEAGSLNNFMVYYKLYGPDDLSKLTIADSIFCAVDKNSVVNLGHFDRTRLISEKDYLIEIDSSGRTIRVFHSNSDVQLGLEKLLRLDLISPSSNFSLVSENATHKLYSNLSTESGEKKSITVSIPKGQKREVMIKIESVGMKEKDKFSEHYSIVISLKEVFPIVKGTNVLSSKDVVICKDDNIYPTKDYRSFEIISVD